MTLNQVLVIEDNHDLRVWMRQILEESGYHVASATNGKDALSILRNGFTPKLLLLDINMPIMSGEEFLNQFRDHTKTSIPTLIVTGDQEKALQFKNVSYLLKPFNPEDLFDKMNECLKTAQ